MNNNDTLTDRRIWLAVPHDEKETAVAGGGRGEDGQNHVQWDKESRLWYAKPGTPKKNISPGSLIVRPQHPGPPIRVKSSDRLYRRQAWCSMDCL